MRKILIISFILLSITSFAQYIIRIDTTKIPTFNDTLINGKLASKYYIPFYLGTSPKHSGAIDSAFYFNRATSELEYGKINAGSGTVTSIATTSPITGGTITTTGTIALDTTKAVLFNDTLTAGKIASKYALSGKVGATDTITNRIKKLSYLYPALSDTSVSGDVISLKANETQNFGDVVYIDADGEAHLAKADAIANCGYGQFLMCAGYTVANCYGRYLVRGTARMDAWNWSLGATAGQIYITTTGTKGNTMTQTQPSGANNVIAKIAVALHADYILFNGNATVIEHN